MGKQIYFTPGPSQLYHTYDYHLKKSLNEQIGSISHRGTAFQQLYQETEEALRALMGIPTDFRVLFLSSATDIWERILLNLVDQQSHHFVNGAFSQRFFDFAKSLGKNSTLTEATPGEEFAQFDIPQGTELIGITQNETSTGYAFDPKRLSEVRAAAPDSLISLDVVSSAPAVPLDFSLVDMAYFSVQKSFGMPAGLGVWIVNEKAIERAAQLKASGKSMGTYRSLEAMVKSASKHQTPETPNVVAIYILGKIAQDMMDRGIQMIRNETIYKSTLLYQTLEAHELLKPFVKEKPNRSKTVPATESTDGAFSKGRAHAGCRIWEIQKRPYSNCQFPRSLQRSGRNVVRQVGCFLMEHY